MLSVPELGPPSGDGGKLPPTRIRWSSCSEGEWSGTRKKKEGIVLSTPRENLLMQSLKTKRTNQHTKLPNIEGVFFFHHTGDIISVPSRSPGRLGLRIKAASRADQCLQGNEPDQSQPEVIGDENTSKLWLLQISSPLKNSSSITGSAHSRSLGTLCLWAESPQNPAVL